MSNNSPVHEPDADALLIVRGLSMQYMRGGLLQKRLPVAAVTDVHFEIKAGQTLGLVGASGSGKSTVARCVTRIEKPNSGQIWLHGTDIAQLGRRALLPFRTQIQMIFQDAATSMNPRFSAAEVLEEPLLIQGIGRGEREHRAETIMKEVALSPDWLRRPVADFSGGQRHRLAIARALILRPKLLVLDEAFSGLDLSTRAQIANLLLDLQVAHSMTYLLISHDLPLVERIADKLAIISQGRIVDAGDPEEVLEHAKHNETGLLSGGGSQLMRSRGASA
jgi:ABC-type glutathione transport system ATPase component